MYFIRVKSQVTSDSTLFKKKKKPVAELTWAEQLRHMLSVGVWKEKIFYYAVWGFFFSFFSFEISFK